MDASNRDGFNGTEGKYLPPHHREEIARLERQHYFIKAATDDKLTPVQLPVGSKALNAGCADGTWLLDLEGTDRPDLQLHGVDLARSLFRDDPRLQLREYNVRTPLPSAWRDSFDLVHQRLLVWCLGMDEWAPALANLADVITPGGILQLVEAEWVLSSYVDECVQQRKLARVQEWSTASSGMDVHIWKRLPGLLSTLGFQDVQVEEYNLGYGTTCTRPEDRIWAAELLPQSFRHLVRKIPADGVPGVTQTPRSIWLGWMNWW
ncbi:hypothetical protein N8T08_002518 [Aspergillus melleus]|uniref:Uncharacterized protein n=1 Tax=Aspergillus melleus TaxID=138277 RepID=A0ACC3B8V5_9EURO|nr:hypothetical protein N8T08_002518 [Aspergillus melleus]